MTRLTKKYNGENKLYANSYVKPDYEDSFDWDERCIDKLGKLEDIMEKYDINSAEELERVILNEATGEQSFKDYIEVYVKPYKDIEEELGIDLITLFKAFSKGSMGSVYKFIQNDYSEEYKKGLIKPFIINYFFRKPNTNEYQLCVYDSLTGKNYIVDTKDYGKTWALTKEEFR